MDRLLIIQKNSCLYECMKSAATSEFVALRVESPAVEFDDFDRLVERYRPKVLRFLYASLRDMDVAESIAQDCFWNAYKSRKSFRGDCSVNTWLTKIAINLVRSHLQNRRLQFWKKWGNSDSGEVCNWPDRKISPEESASVQQQIQAVWGATRLLSQKQRTVFLLRFMEDMDIAEIAQSTGLSENTVKVHLFRAVRGIRKHLGAPQ